MYSYHECNMNFNHVGVDPDEHKRDNTSMDMQKITSELIDTGLTQQELAVLVPCSQSTISAFLNGNRGSRPSLVIGHRLLQLHQERVLAIGGCGPSRRNDDLSLMS